MICALMIGRAGSAGFPGKNIYPVLTPLAVDPSHPFPYISGLSLNLAVTVINKETNEYLASINFNFSTS